MTRENCRGRDNRPSHRPSKEGPALGHCQKAGRCSPGKRSRPQPPDSGQYQVPTLHLPEDWGSAEGSPETSCSGLKMGQRSWPPYRERPRTFPDGISMNMAQTP